MFDPIEISAGVDSCRTLRAFANQYGAVLFEGCDRNDKKLQSERRCLVTRCCGLVGLPGMLTQQLVRHDAKGVLMRGLKNDGRRHASRACLEPTACAQAPTIARLEAGKTPLWARRHEIIASQHGEVEELAGYPGTNRMAPGVVRTSVAAAGSHKTGQRIKRARL